MGDNSDSLVHLVVKVRILGFDESHINNSMRKGSALIITLGSTQFIRIDL